MSSVQSPWDYNRDSRKEEKKNRAKYEQEHGQTSHRTWPNGQKKKTQGKTQPVRCHRCQASRIQFCRMIMRSTVHTRFTTILQPVSICRSWTFWIVRVTLHDCEAAQCITTGGTCEVPFLAACLTVFPFKFWPLTFAIKNLWKEIDQIRDHGFGVHVRLKLHLPNALIMAENPKCGGFVKDNIH